MKSEPVQLAAHVRHCRAKPCKKVEGNEGADAHRVLPRPGHLPLRGSPGSSAVSAEGARKHGPARSVEALGTDAGEVERLARRLEPHNHRMAQLLRRGVLDQSLAYAFPMNGRVVGHRRMREQWLLLSVTAAPSARENACRSRVGCNVEAVVCTV